MIRKRSLLYAIISLAVAAVALLPAAAQSGVGLSTVTIDFSSFNSDPSTIEPIDGDYFAADGIRFSTPCNADGCSILEVGMVQGDAALRQRPFLGGFEASLSRPVSAISVRFAPGLQGTATYVLRAYSASGDLLASTSTTVTQDFGDPANTGFGHINLSLDDLPAPAKKLTLDSIFVRSSYTWINAIDFGIHEITYTHWSR
jgi:hypothetical protein